MVTFSESRTNKKHAKKKVFTTQGQVKYSVIYIYV